MGIPLFGRVPQPEPSTMELQQAGQDAAESLAARQGENKVQFWEQVIKPTPITEATAQEVAKEWGLGYMTEDERLKVRQWSREKRLYIDANLEEAASDINAPMIEFILLSRSKAEAGADGFNLLKMLGTLSILKTVRVPKNQERQALLGGV